VILYGTIFSSDETSLCLRPMNLFIEKTVCCGFVTCWCLAICPTNLSFLSVKPTTEGVSREPLELMSTLGAEPSITAQTEFVVPKSIPIIFAIFQLPFM
jgi:hypothetical protein